MTLTVQDRHFHDVYESLPEPLKQAVDRCYEEVCTECRYHNVKPLNDDTAEQLVAALARYIKECNTQQLNKDAK
jgi:hypothetical protein